MGDPSLHLGHWHRAAVEPAERASAPAPAAPTRATAGPTEGGLVDDPPFAAHLHGRDLVVVHEAAPPHWHWRVTSPHGAILAEGDAPTRDAAEQAAEDEATAIHPPTDALMDRLLS